MRRVVDALNARQRDAEGAKVREAEELKRQQEEVARLEAEKKERKRQAAKQRQQESTARRQKQARLEQERLAAEQRQREQAEAQRTEQESQQQTVQKRRDIEFSSKDYPLQQNFDNQDNAHDGAISSAAVVETVDANNEPIENVKRETFIEKVAIWEIPLDRRSTLLWLAGGIGGLIVWGATSKKGVSQSNQVTNSGENAPELKTFNFSVISLNTQGEEVNRVQKKNEYFSENLGQGISLDMVVVPGSNFMMGSPDGEGYADEKPQHQVMVKPFYMGKFPVTQAQWKAVSTMPKVQRELKPDPSTFKGMMRPVEEVSWNDAVEFCQRLSRYSNRQYRLPNEAEWEFACRAGTSTPFSFGPTITTNLVNYNGNYIYGFASKGMMLQETTEVGSFLPNAFGLYDMHGNVWEWCEDHWHDNYDDAPKFNYSWLSKDESTPRLLRGGSWHDDPKNCRSASRYKKVSGLVGSLFGFRVVCVPV
ncbi:SUMF1/EgtB/PvdO family nonheme iron enzyme [Nodosilinea sp. LEGE 07298]|nr:SUMF1/EgtB/PvdO family nonheme iron enzyme [Nodosilinea sp. LEGE 07298]